MSVSGPNSIPGVGQSLPRDGGSDRSEVRLEGQITVGRLARWTGVSNHTVLYYERRGLLHSARRSPAGYRLYSSEDIRRIHFIRQAKKLGFSLHEIESMLTIHIKPGALCDGLHGRLLEKIADIDRSMRELRTARRSLERLVAECDEGRPLDECALLKRLEGAVPLESCSIPGASRGARR